MGVVVAVSACPRVGVAKRVGIDVAVNDAVGVVVGIEVRVGRATVRVAACADGDGVGVREGGGVLVGSRVSVGVAVRGVVPVVMSVKALTSRLS